MDQTLRQIAGYAHHWLENWDGTDDSLFILADDNESGIDVAYQAAKLYYGAHRMPAVKFDRLPTFAFNPDTGCAVFFLSQPNHVPAVQTTMQGALGRLRQVDPETAKEETVKVLAGEVGLQELSSEDSDLVVDSISADKDHPGEVQAPVEIIVDQREPMWSEIKQFIVPETKVHMTERVEIGPGMVPEEGPQNLDPDRYDPEAD